MKYISITAVAISLFVAGCASTSKPPVQMVNISIPDLNTESSVDLGERMMMQAMGRYGESVTLSGAEGTYSKISAGTYCNFNPSTNYFVNLTNETAVSLKNAFGAVLKSHAVVEYDRTSNKVCASDLMATSCYDSSEMKINYKVKDLCLDANSFQQVIEYNGKSGQILNFTYREFSKDMARQAFTTNFTIDLAESNIASYKGAQIKIINATNSKITYTILKNFNTY